jgi:hypothetical protein
MTRVIPRALAAAVLGALLGAAFLECFYAIDPRLAITFDIDPPRLVSGVFPAERDPATGLTFAWTGPELMLRLPGLDRSVNWILHVRVRGARKDASENPVLSFFADGVLLDTRQSLTTFDDISVTIPAEPGRRRGVAIAMQSSRTFVPGPADSRALGVMLDGFSLTPGGIALPPRRAFAGASLSAAALGAAVAFLGVTTGSAVGAAVLLSAGAASLLARGFAPYTDYPLLALRAAVWIGILLTLSTAGVERMRGKSLRNTARFVAAFSAGALFLKLLVLLHPNMPVGDAMFHAHKFQGVLAGNLYFTSIAPGNYLFPYAPGLYVFAAPFAGLVTRGAADMALLRIIVVGVDTLAAVLLYTIVVSLWGNRISGAIAVALYHLVPLDFRIVTVGNLTNAFAQSLSVVAFTAFGAGWVRLERRSAVALLATVLSAAFLSHTSTFAILLVTCVLVAVLFAWKGGPALRSPAVAVLVAAGAALAISIGVYYGHFGETYQTELARIGTETATAAPDAGGRGIITRLGSVPRYLNEYLGLPALVLASTGAWRLWRQGARDRLSLSAAAWGISCALFLALGILTPVDMRYYLASIPAVAVAAAAGASALWAESGTGRALAAILLVWAVTIGVATWWQTL